MTANGRVELRVRALPLPASVASTLSDNADLLRSAVEAAERQRAGSSGGAANGAHMGASETTGDTTTANGAAADPDSSRHRSGLPVPSAADAAAEVAGHATDAMAALQKRCVPAVGILI